MKHVGEISVNGAKYKKEYFIGGDWKFLAIVCGMGSANHNYACIWYNCTQLQSQDTSRTWIIERNVENKENSKTRKFNCQPLPPFDFIEMPHVVIDALHLLLRISDDFIENLIFQLKREDGFKKTQIYGLLYQLSKQNWNKISMQDQMYNTYNIILIQPI